ncbi:MAG TPA: nucleotidyl transferase AbiEii/AbiGii toxin family protein [Candidatus Goldiibacteriota bacterium]|nr:nucleotidyl transferase AbiEii/AbiGii toxin family protein [Candidatus Goldiibacteriota bacterium]
MEQQIFEKISAKRGISTDNVLREYYEYVILREMFESEIGDKLAFKGGTALRIFYSSPRYSDDLDFSLLKIIDFKTFKTAMTRIAGKYDNFRINDLWNKYNTMLCEFKIKEEWKKMPLTLKIEISKRKIAGVKDVEIKLARDNDFGLEILGKIFKLECLFKDKIMALNDRDEPKDYFDVWYIGQLLNKKTELKKNVNIKRYRQTLNKYLPEKYRKILDEIL